MIVALLIAGAAAYLAIGIRLSRHFLEGMRSQPLFQSAMEAAPERVAPIAALLSAFAALLWPALVCFSLTLPESRSGLRLALSLVWEAARGRIRHSILGEDLVELMPVRDAEGGLSLIKIRWMTKPKWWQLWRLRAWKRCKGEDEYVFYDGLVVRRRPSP